MTGVATLLALRALLAAVPGDAAPATAGPPAAEPLGVRVRLDKREVRLGEPFELTIEIRHAPAERYSLPAALPVEPFRLLGGGCPRREEGGAAVTTCALRLALFDLGPHDLPPLRLRAETPGGGRELSVPGPTVIGAGVLDPAAPPASLALKDLAPPAPLHVANWPLGAGLLAGALVAAAAWWGGRAWRRRAGRVEAPPPLPPHERFARQLDALEEGRLPGQERCARLSGHVREYLGAISGQNALDLTSAELLARLSFQPDPRLDLGALAAFLEAADFVKFARAPASDADAALAMAFARTLLERTRPRPPPAVAAEAR